MTALWTMSYNVRYDTPGDGDDVWDERRDAVADIVRSRRPALVGFQEPLPHQLTDLRERLPAYEIVGRGRNADGGGERSPIGFRRDRFSVLDRETLWLSETPENPGSVGWDAELPRIATRLRLRDEQTGRTLTHCNTHFAHKGERARREAASLLARRLDGDDPTILTGDFNCEADSPPYRRLVDAGVRDARSASELPPFGPHTTRTDFGSLHPDWIIDHVFVDGPLSVRQCGTCSETDRRHRYPSDHLPVLAELRYEDR
ncbi:endonuclease/exonuclease/phosphatase family protein [Natronoarchaeum sp. GCM10025321]|uniref:endonuclease/exonuclease/phosphatase family protein n=1 Tax=Natronoarchaeum sp. GCM10025321 TaxID=3252684 RepID=UPI003615C1D3